ncbi:TrbC/VirB2 family protein [Ramlibacter alkalitolerans]|uniref:TrbC/VirB2 family protein n=1 Tax=Ramlibacter alkalitolerans TaxID=2039631 RepID=A0ABS1JU47_9BURK|nr:TrbC/VirB2 family protein [Ramlibacter alkalitolerans]MBL0427779.1 TrbC/VirB2 family protein [Ramlibacter alkalitolerans]
MKTAKFSKIGIGFALMLLSGLALASGGDDGLGITTTLTKVANVTKAAGGGMLVLAILGGAIAAFTSEHGHLKTILRLAIAGAVVLGGGQVVQTFFSQGFLF